MMVHVNMTVSPLTPLAIATQGIAPHTVRSQELGRLGTHPLALGIRVRTRFKRGPTAALSHRSSRAPPPRPNPSGNARPTLTHPQPEPPPT